MRKNKGIDDVKRLAILEEYLQSDCGKFPIEKKHGLSSGSIRNWLRIFALEDKYSNEGMKKEEIDQPSSDEEIATLKLRIKQLEAEIKNVEMARDAYDFMISLAEDKYHIPVRKNSDAR